VAGMAGRWAILSRYTSLSRPASRHQPADPPSMPLLTFADPAADPDPDPDPGANISGRGL
jgi:hypothetical protein